MRRPHIPSLVGLPESSPKGHEQANAIVLRFAWPETTELPFREDFFFGAWHPNAELELVVESPPESVSPVICRSFRSFLVCNSADFYPGAALIHKAPVMISGKPHMLAFRGYVVEPPVHCWSGTGHVYDYWQKDLFRQHNGIFATARMLPDRLELVTDAFGISPLYYRLLENGTVLFATSARYLRVAGDDEPDPVAARMMLHRGSLCADMSWCRNTRRCKPGHVITFANSGKTERPWFRFDALPAGAQRITAENLRAAEDVFQQAIDRCLRLMPGVEPQLPLSSGDDSRRILAALLDRRLPFQALTVRVRQKQYRDLDGRFAADMASALGFAHEVIELPDPFQTGIDHHVARTLFSSELLEHGWMPPLIRHLRRRGSLVFDGLGGDIFGIPALPFRSGIPCRSGASWNDWRASFCHRGQILLIAKMPSRPLSKLGKKWSVYLSILPEAPNRADYAFALIRARRGTGPSLQHLLPPGYIAAYPYFDLDHVRVTMELDSLDKIEEKLQARCLRVFWPDIYKFPGSRRIPPGIPEGPASFILKRKRACTAQLRAECRSPQLLPEAGDMLKPRRYIEAVLSGHSRRVEDRISWWLDRALLLLSCKNSSRVCWSVAETIRQQYGDSSVRMDRSCGVSEASRGEQSMKVTVVGTGHGGCAMAAVMGMRGHEVSMLKLGTRMHVENFHVLEAQMQINLEGIEGHGTFPIHRLSTAPKEVIPDAELVLVYYVANYHPLVAEALAPHLHRGQTVVLNPGYAGSLIFVKSMRAASKDGLPLFAEFETLPYSSRITSPGTVSIVSRNCDIPLRRTRRAVPVT